MTTGITLSAFSSKNPSIQSMILSAVPEGLQRLAECGERLPRVLPMLLTIDELDAIVEGKNTEDLESSIADGLYLQNVLPAINWWLDVAQDMSGGNGMKHTLWSTAHENQKRNLIALLNDVLSSYAAAFAEAGLSFSASPRIPAGMEMLKRYRLFTRYVCAFAKEVWPEVELGWLLKQA
jgi:hypothetical protein